MVAAQSGYARELARALLQTRTDSNDVASDVGLRWDRRHRRDWNRCREYRRSCR